MMDIARHGIMMPARYSLHEVMTVFLAVMVTDVIILDVFNSLGMPTATSSPSANATYKLDEKNQIRLSYGRSVNRPEFREVSPSVYYDFDLASNVEGNFNLKNCYVDNLDVSYEWYPSRDEMISFPKRSGDQRSDLRLRGCRNNHRPRAGELLQR